MHLRPPKSPAPVVANHKSSWTSRWTTHRYQLPAKWFRTAPSRHQSAPPSPSRAALRTTAGLPVSESFTRSLRTSRSTRWTACSAKSGGYNPSFSANSRLREPSATTTTPGGIPPTTAQRRKWQDSPEHRSPSHRGPTSPTPAAHSTSPAAATTSTRLGPERRVEALRLGCAPRRLAQTVWTSGPWAGGTRVPFIRRRRRCWWGRTRCWGIASASWVSLSSSKLVTTRKDICC